MKSEGIHISLCCEHCGERVPRVVHEFNCPHCFRLCQDNTDVSGALMRMAELIQAMTPAELAEMLRKGESDAD